MAARTVPVHDGQVRNTRLVNPVTRCARVGSTVEICEGKESGRPGRKKNPYHGLQPSVRPKFSSMMEVGSAQK